MQSTAGHSLYAVLEQAWQELFDRHAVARSPEKEAEETW
jgi:hypothetical protein